MILITRWALRRTISKQAAKVVFFTFATIKTVGMLFTALDYFSIKIIKIR